MAYKTPQIFSAVKGKVIFALIFAGLAMLLAWGVSKVAFGEILGTIKEITAPNDKLRLVNRIAHQLSNLDNLQQNAQKKADFTAASKQLGASLDTLAILYKDDEKQLNRIGQLKVLLANRDVQFANYLKVKQRLLSTQSFTADMQKLNDLLAKEPRGVDSTTFTTETSTQTKTMAPNEQEDNRGFFSRLFGKRKAEAYKIISEEYKIKRDTLNADVRDSVTKNVALALKDLAYQQRRKSDSFIKKEGDLADASGAITGQMLSVLKEVETEALTQLDKNSFQAKSIINDGVQQIKIIIIVFFVIIILMGYFILADINKNIKYRKALEEAKEEAEYHGKAKQRFLSNMSHEIRTPLQSILGYSELVAQQENPSRSQLEAIHQSSVHLLQIVNEVLDYNRIVSGEFVFEQHNFKLLSLLDEVFAAVQPLATAKNIKLIAQFDIASDLWLLGDAFRLKQMLYNLLGNAIKFTNNGHVKLSVTAHPRDNYFACAFTVEDTGIGFAMADQERIFNEFEQVNTSAHQAVNRNGAGLGLAIVKTLVNGLGGTIKVRSELNRGSSFKINLDFLTGTETAQTLKTHYAGLVGNQMVWVVDDDKLITNLCTAIFSKYNIPFRVFNTANEILSQPVDENLQFVLLDMRLEGTNGIALHEKLKPILPKNVRFYAITAQVLPDEQAAVLACGFTDIIIKPFKMEDLLAIFNLADKADEAIIFDDKYLLKMTMGDREMAKNILQQFVDDCNTDEQLIKASVVKNDMAELRLLVHRLAGRIAQIGDKDLGGSFRTLELAVAKVDVVNTELEEQIATCLLQLHKLIQAVKSY